MHAIIGKMDFSLISLVDDARLDEGCHITMDGFDVARNAACNLAD